MNLDLKELGITFIVGAFFVLGVDAILYYYFGCSLTGFFQSARLRRNNLGPPQENQLNTDEREKDGYTVRSMRTVVFVGVAFGIGLLAEDLSYKYVDTIPTPTPFKLPAWINSILPSQFKSKLNLPSKEGSRIKTLITNFESDKPEVESLGLDLANNKAFEQVYGKGGVKIDNWVVRIHKCKLARIKECEQTHISASECEWYRKDDDKCHLFSEDEQDQEAIHSRKEVEDAIYGLYYHAKNTDYLVPDYYDELRRIETRRDFARSIGLIAFFFLVVALFLAFARIIHSIIRYGIRRRKPNHRHKGSPASVSRHRIWVSGIKRKVNFRIVLVCVMLSIIYFCGMWAYEKESDEFNKRAFGYYRSELVRLRTRNSTTTWDTAPNRK